MFKKVLIFVAALSYHSNVRAFDSTAIKDFTIGFIVQSGINDAIPEGKECFEAGENAFNSLKNL